MICYDTVNWYVLRENVSEKSIEHFISVVPNFVSAVETKTNLLTGYGNLNKYLKISITRNRIRVCGSIPKSIHKTNQKSVSLEEVASFFDWFTDILHIHRQDIIVTRIDMAANLKMEHPPICYFNYLGESTYMERSPLGTSLYYKSGYKEYVLYDKGVEVKAKKGKVVSGNLLRAELKLNNNIPAQMKKGVITAMDLCNMVFYNELVEKWIWEYNRIEKIKPIIDYVDILKTTTRTETKNCLFANLMGEKNKQNPLFTTDLIKSMRQIGSYSNPNYYTELKKDFDKLSDLYVIKKRSDLEAELTYKINSVQRAS